MVGLNRSLAMNLIVRRQFVKIISRQLSTTSKLCGGYASHGGEHQPQPIRVNIGTREVVGYGMNGDEIYFDHIHCPFPGIRFKEDNPSILKIKEKEKGDWRKLTIEEKKELYRASFCQTFAERHANTYELRTALGIALNLVALSVWGFIWLRLYVVEELPSTMTDETHQRKQLQLMIDQRVGGIEGFTSNYDYDKNEWKK